MGGRGRSVPTHLDRTHPPPKIYFLLYLEDVDSFRYLGGVIKDVIGRMNQGAKVSGALN